ncbi:MAG: peptidylprolyl isomerase [Planctomycetaceae bacterium]|nr:peptidylprolyl isomerase [Planctomycetaceae bacterium]
MWFSRTSRRDRSARSKTQRSVSAVTQGLERRALLAGNAVIHQTASSVTIDGDSADNTIEVTVLSNGLVVRGLNGTTINGGTDDVVLVSGSNTLNGRLQINGYAGNDTIMFSRNATFNGTVVVDAGAGDDQIGSTGAVFGSSLYVHGRAGDDDVSIKDSSVTGLLWIKTLGGNDVVSINTVDVTGRIKIKTGSGDDDVVLEAVTTTAKTTIHTESGNDDVAVRNSTLGALLKVKTRQQDDTTMLEGNTFGGAVAINSGKDDDSVFLRGTNTFQGRFSVQSGDGNFDEVQLGGTPTFNGGRSVRKSESDTASPSSTDRIDNASTGALARATAVDSVFTQLLVSSPQDLTVDTGANTTEASGVGDGVLITKQQNFVINGTATPRSTIEIDLDGDNAFDDGTATVDDNGDYSITVTLKRRDLDTSTTEINDELSGLQTVIVRATDEAGGVQSNSFVVDYVIGSVVQFVSNMGTYEVEMFDSLTPTTVQNFKNYFARYETVVIHRSVNDFVIQGGGYTLSNSGVFAHVPEDAPITNEFNSNTSNIRGTLSMALAGGDINSGNSEWFINTGNNDGRVNEDLTPRTNLNTAGHTVFGRVLGNGMTIVDGIAALNQADISGASSIGALATIPRQNTFVPLDTPITGTVSLTAASDVLTGTGTKFTEELTAIDDNPGGSSSRLSINGQLFRVQSITSDTELTLTAVAAADATDVIATTDFFDPADFVRFTSIGEILDTV